MKPQTEPQVPPSSPLTAADVFAAAGRISPLIRKTRLLHSEPLSTLVGGEVLLKLENEQITGSFKLRGALNVLATLSDDARLRGVVASSAGNHGLGVAYAARHFGVPATIFVPNTVPQVKRDGIVAYGATIDTSQPHYDAAMSAAKAFAATRGATFINPCLGDMLLAGQGTVALEILTERPDLGTLIVSVGGGGLLGGCAALLLPSAPSVRIVGAQSENTAAMARSVAAKRVVEIENLPTLADGLAGQIDQAALEIGLRSLDEIVLVTEDDIGRAIIWLGDQHDVRAEGAGAVGVAALLAGKLGPFRYPVAIVISGGNIDVARLDAIRGSKRERSTP